MNILMWVDLEVYLFNISPFPVYFLILVKFIISLNEWDKMGISRKPAKVIHCDRKITQLVTMENERCNYSRYLMRMSTTAWVWVSMYVRIVSHTSILV